MISRAIVVVMMAASVAVSAIGQDRATNAVWNQFSDKDKMRSKACTDCHNDNAMSPLITSKGKSIFVGNDFIHAKHAKRQCVECHVGFDVVPHVVKGFDRDQCVKCHFGGNKVGAPDIPEKYREYDRSIHGQFYAQRKRSDRCDVCHASTAKFQGKERPDQCGRPASCLDCHWSDGGLPGTKVDFTQEWKRARVPSTCGKCHQNIAITYRDSIHGKAAIEKGNPDAPVCTNCHGEHAIFQKTSLEAKSHPANVVKLCSSCHAAMPLLQRNKMPVDRLSSYDESFHGKAYNAGLTTVANCESCHGHHDILPATDVRSAVHPTNLAKTCGKANCHSGISADFKVDKIHGPSIIVKFVGFMMQLLIVGTMAALIFYIIMENVRARQIKKTYAAYAKKIGLGDD